MYFIRGVDNTLRPKIEICVFKVTWNFLIMNGRDDLFYFEIFFYLRRTGKQNDQLGKSLGNP